MYRLTGKTISQHNEDSRRGEKIYHPIYFMIDWEREVLYDRINRRVDIMMEQGLLQEVKKCLDMGLNAENTAMQAIGYKELAEYINGDIESVDAAVEKIKMESRRYAKRQICWFKRKNYHHLVPETAADDAEIIIRRELEAL